MNSQLNTSTLAAPTMSRLSRARASRWAALPVVLAGTFMVVLDFFIVNVALPSLQHDLHASGSAIEWVVAGYALTSAVFLITAARLGDQLGRRRTFLAGLGVFTLSSAACGVAGAPVTTASAATGTVTPRPVGDLLRAWRQRRSLSQLELASNADVSSRHVSFVETGRARPSRQMLLHLAEHLEVPLRERNGLLLAAGYAPSYAERSLETEAMTPVRQALDRFLRAHEPYPAVVVDRHYTLVAANDAINLLTEGAAPEPPANGLRLTLHPLGIAPRIVNLEEWSAHLLLRLRRQASITGDPALQHLHDELSTYPGVRLEAPHDEITGAEIVLPLRLRDGDQELAFFSTISTFGTAVDITFAELAIEAFYPANAHTASRLLQDIGADASVAPSS